MDTKDTCCDNRTTIRVPETAETKDLTFVEESSPKNAASLEGVDNLLHYNKTWAEKISKEDPTFFERLSKA
jgi:carbonic anhydrase